MSSINAIRVKNLRSLSDTGEIPIKKLTLLVGRNSGGKSTFARIMPLIRQSTEVRKKSPLLWYGRLVDFGSFKDSVKESDLNNEIEFSFRIALDRFTTRSDSLTAIESDAPPYDVLASITLKAAKKNRGETAVSQLAIDFEGVRCELLFVEEKLQSIKVGELIEFINPALHQNITFTGLLPIVKTFKMQKMKIGEQEISVPNTTNVFSGPIVRNMLSVAKTGLSADSAEIFAEKFIFGTNKEILAQLKAQTEGPTRWLNLCKVLDEKSSMFERIRNEVLIASLPRLLTDIDEAITAVAKNVSYLEPLRATAQRYYRRQELAVDELDSRGENVPFYLDNLENYEKHMLDQWLQKHFGISVETESSGGHIAIRLKLSKFNKAVNLADTGFGYSQVLPIALQLWKLTQGDRFKASTNTHNQKMIVMEQPELHLHPALQSKLADIFAASISDNLPNYYGDSDLRIIVETHSPSLINRLGELVSLGVVNPDHVQVLVFEKEEKSGMTSTRISEYDKDGRLKNWPNGFFNAIDDDEY